MTDTDSKLQVNIESKTEKRAGIPSFPAKVFTLLMFMVLIPPAALLILIAIIILGPIVVVSGFMGGPAVGILCLAMLPLAIIAVPILTCISPFFLLYAAFTNEVWRDSKQEAIDEQEKQKTTEIEAFNEHWERIRILPVQTMTDESIRNLINAKERLLDSTSEFCDNCTGEAKYLLRCAAKLIQNEGEFGSELVGLIDKVISHSFSYNENDTKSGLHKMIWDCARLITLRLEASGVQISKRGIVSQSLIAKVAKVFQESNQN